MRRERIILQSVLSLLILAASASAQQRPGHYAGQSALRASLGSFSPDGESNYWREKELDFIGSTSGFDDLTLSLDYTYFVSPRVGVLVSFGGWESEQTQAYREFVDPAGRDIAHLTTIEETWIDVGVVLHVLSRRAAVMPYVGAGGSFVFWELREEGEFIDFDVSPPTIFNDSFFADGDSFGYFLLAGLEIPVSDNVALFVEGRWRGADDELSRDFAGFGTLDLSGRSLSGGVSVVF